MFLNKCTGFFLFFSKIPLIFQKKTTPFFVCDCYRCEMGGIGEGCSYKN